MFRYISSVLGCSPYGSLTQELRPRAPVRGHDGRECSLAMTLPVATNAFIGLERSAIGKGVALHRWSRGRLADSRKK